jgi:hypothetical protein
MSENFGHPESERNPWEDLGIAHLDFEPADDMIAKMSHDAILDSLDFTPDVYNRELFSNNVLREFIVSSLYRIHEMRRTSLQEADYKESLVLTLPRDWKGYIVELHPLESRFVQNPSLTLYAADLRDHSIFQDETKTAYLNNFTDWGGSKNAKDHIRKRDRRNQAPFENFDRSELEIIAHCVDRYVLKPGKKYDEVIDGDDSLLRFAYLKQKPTHIQLQKEQENHQSSLSPEQVDLVELLPNTVLDTAEQLGNEQGVIAIGDVSLVKETKLTHEIGELRYTAEILTSGNRINGLSLNCYKKTQKDHFEDPYDNIEITILEDRTIIVDKSPQSSLVWNQLIIEELFELGKLEKSPQTNLEYEL